MKTTITASFLLDVHSGQLMENPVLVIEGNRISQVGTRQDIPVDPDSPVIDLPGMTLLPGLIDAHVHLGLNGETGSDLSLVRELVPFQTARAVEYLRRDLTAGFTTLRTVGDKGFLDVGLKQAINAGFITGPRLFTCGHMLAVTGGRDAFVPGLEFNDSMFTVFDGPEGAARAARSELKYDVDWVKLGVTGAVTVGKGLPGAQQMTLSELQTIAEVVHLVGKKVAGHAHGAAGVKDCIRAGIDSIEHGALMDDEAIGMLADSGNYLVPTLAPVYLIIKHGTAAGISRTMVERAKSVMETHLAGFAKAVRAGVKIVMGTDTGMPCNPHGGNALEIQLMAEAGLDNLGAIRAATVTAAAMLDAANDIGAIQPGLYADIIAVSGNPLADIKTLHNPSFVMKGGKVVNN